MSQRACRTGATVIPRQPHPRGRREWEIAVMLSTSKSRLRVVDERDPWEDPEASIRTICRPRLAVVAPLVAPVPPPRPRTAPGGDAALAIMISLPYAAGYVMSYLFGPAGGSFAHRLAGLADFGSDDTGLHAALYFLAFALVQWPAGPLIDRHGLRSLQVASLLVSASGAFLIAVADVWPTLLLGRALICLSSAGAFAAVARAVLQCLPPQRRAIADCALVLCGGLVATASTMPLGVIITDLDWRAFYVILATATIGFAGLVWMVSPGTRTAS